MWPVRPRGRSSGGVPVPVVWTRLGHMAGRLSRVGGWPVVAAVPGVASGGLSRMLGHLGRVVRLVGMVRSVGRVAVVGRVRVVLVVRLGAGARWDRCAALVVVVIRRPRAAAMAAVGVGEAAASDSVSLRSHVHQQLSGP